MQTAVRCAEATCVRCRRSAAGERGWRLVAQARGLKDCAVWRSRSACSFLEEFEELRGEDGCLGWES